MTTWMVTCQNCGTENDALNGTVIIECGIVSCRCTCVNCTHEVNDQQEFWQWLGLTEGPPDELD